MDVIFLLGILFGIRHALDADHLITVISMNSQAHLQSKTIATKPTLAIGFTWAIGHSITVLIFGGLVILFTPTIPEYVSRLLEGLVGAMLVIMGLQILTKIKKDKLHIHIHKHSNCKPHLHLHSHKTSSSHHHQHPSRLKINSLASKISYKKPLLMGMLHGSAGTTALIVLAFEAATSELMRFIYLLFFVLGTLIGMVIFSAVISIPISKVAKSSTKLINLKHIYISIAALSCSCGTWVIAKQFI